MHTGNSRECLDRQVFATNADQIGLLFQYYQGLHGSPFALFRHFYELQNQTVRFGKITANFWFVRFLGCLQPHLMNLKPQLSYFCSFSAIACASYDNTLCGCFFLAHLSKSSE